MKIPKQLKSKTVWTGITGVITAVGGFCTGTMDPQSAIQLAVISFLGIFTRTGLMNNGGRK